MNDIIYKIALNSVFGYEISLANKLLDQVERIQDIFTLEDGELECILPGRHLLYEKLTEELLQVSERNYEYALANGYEVISREDFPESLVEIPDAPLVLFVGAQDGAKKVLSAEHMISIIGTRNMTSYGKQMCRKIVESIASACPQAVIVSGLAMGCDITAHLTALDSGLGTIACMGTGIDTIYPVPHVNYAQRIASSPRSGIITDFEPYSPVYGVNFLRRNRIVAALCQNLIVIESAFKGGSLSTAHYAFDYDKTVWALPGRYDDKFSQGCNNLIYRDIARIIGDIDALPYEMEICNNAPKKKALMMNAADIKNWVFTHCAASPFKEQLFDLVKILNVVKTNRDIQVEDIAARLSLPEIKVSTLVSYLESEGAIERDLFGACSFVLK